MWFTVAAKKTIEGAFVGVMDEQFHLIKMHGRNNLKICLIIFK
jgi:hypothetical protein